MIYFMWQLNMSVINDSVSTALQRYIAKYGLPDQIVVEKSEALEEIKLPEHLNIVVRSVRMPKNILLIGESHEASSVRMETLTEQNEMDL